MPGPVGPLSIAFGGNMGVLNTFLGSINPPIESVLPWGSARSPGGVAARSPRSCRALSVAFGRPQCPSFAFSHCTMAPQAETEHKDDAEVPHWPVVVVRRRQGPTKGRGLTRLWRRCSTNHVDSDEGDAHNLGILTMDASDATASTRIRAHPSVGQCNRRQHHPAPPVTELKNDETRHGGCDRAAISLP